jgi:hypothetical protein
MSDPIASFDDEFVGGAKGFSYSQLNPETGQPNPYFVPLNQAHGGSVRDVKTKIPVTEFTGPHKGEPKYWDKAQTNPMLQKVILVDTRAGKTPAAPTGPEDDGMRSIWVRDSSELDKAIRNALSQAPGLRAGSELYIVNTGTRPSKIGGNPARTFKAQHVPASAPPADDMFGGQPAAPAQQPVAPVGQQPPVPQQAYAPAANPFGGGQPAAAPPAPPAVVAPPVANPVPPEWAAAGWTQQAYDQHVAAQQQPPAVPAQPANIGGGAPAQAYNPFA